LKAPAAGNGNTSNATAKAWRRSEGGETMSRGCRACAANYARCACDCGKGSVSPKHLFDTGTPCRVPVQTALQLGVWGVGS
jgi:phosphoribosyl 1,2-cyclic phosphodiesterase